MPLCMKHRINYGNKSGCPQCGKPSTPQGSVKSSPGVVEQKPNPAKGALTALIQKEVSRG